MPAVGHRILFPSCLAFFASALAWLGRFGFFPYRDYIIHYSREYIIWQNERYLREYIVQSVY